MRSNHLKQYSKIFTISASICGRTWDRYPTYNIYNEVAGEFLTTGYHIGRAPHETYCVRRRSWSTIQSARNKVSELERDFYSTEANREEHLSDNCCDCSCCTPQTNYCPTCGTKLREGDES